jgi:ribosomal-protein-alanine N-acetyltransferase
VGYLICARYDEAYHVMTIAVDPDHRRAGIASTLLDALIERAGEDANYTLEVRVSNLGAIALYERYGFRSVGNRPRYYADNGEDALIMWRALGTPWEAA